MEDNKTIENIEAAKLCKLNIDGQKAEIKSIQPLIIFSKKIAEEMICSYGCFSKMYRIEKSTKDPLGKRHVWYFYRDDDVLEAFETLKKEAISYRKEKEKLAQEGDIHNG